MLFSAGGVFERVSIPESFLFGPVYRIWLSPPGIKGANKQSKRNKTEHFPKIVIIAKKVLSDTDPRGRATYQLQKQY